MGFLPYIKNYCMVLVVMKMAAYLITSCRGVPYPFGFSNSGISVERKYVHVL